MRRSPARVQEWNWNWTAVRPERYIFLNILVTVRNRLVTQPCHLLATTHYVPTTSLGTCLPCHRRGIPSSDLHGHHTRLALSFPVFLRALDFVSVHFFHRRIASSRKPCRLQRFSTRLSAEPVFREAFAKSAFAGNKYSKHAKYLHQAVRI